MGGSRGAETAVGPKPQHSLQDLKHAAQTLWQETQASIADSRQRFQAYHEKAQSCKQVTSMLKGLPKRPSHDIMLPLGKAALLPARLVNIERCSMSLGEHLDNPCMPGARFWIDESPACVHGSCAATCCHRCQHSSLSHLKVGFARGRFLAMVQGMACRLSAAERRPWLP